ncbi:hypothetical protein HF324_18520 [Chitinophaga oryzae]|uniref:Uncharacterized protein n=1 Tax=Chitinophaga oryzae TaxID=2725414 RepID=A0ABX6LHZ6_9BACT|nr:hypothetical protein [Chitinophaga oryzae]QJB39744.1 hypothetical protein HF324_18520 [Chitinophaga oryzae]
MNKLPKSFTTRSGDQVLIHQLSEKAVKLEILIPGQQSEEIIFSEEVSPNVKDGHVFWSFKQHEALVGLFQIMAGHLN